MIKYNTKKKKNQDLIELIDKHVTNTTLDRIGTCCNYLELIADKELDKKKMVGGKTCGNRFCPLCSWRKAKKDAMVISVLMRYIEQAHGKIFLFITLTTPNVYGNDLKSEIAKMNRAFKNMMLRKEFLLVNKGYIRKLEVTYDCQEYITHDMYFGNPKRHMKSRMKYYMALGLNVGDKNPNYETYHPHFHVVMAVNKSYFTSRDYINQIELLNMWRDVMNDQTITQVRIQKVGRKKDKDGIEIVDSAINEVAKYSAKDAEYMLSQEVFDVFYTALKGAQVLTYNGLFKDAMKLFKDKKLEAYKQVDPTEYYWLLCNQWNMQYIVDEDSGEILAEPNQYIEIERRELTDDELLKYNFKAVSESEELTDD